MLGQFIKNIYTKFQYDRLINTQVIEARPKMEKSKCTNVGKGFFLPTGKI